MIVHCISQTYLTFVINWIIGYLPPANVVCEGYIFTGICDSVNRGGMPAFCRGACVLLFGGVHGFIQGGMHGFIWGACVVLFGGMHGFIWEAAWFYSEGRVWFYLGGAWFYLGGHAWFYLGDVRGFIRGHAWFYSGGVHGFISFFRYNEIWSMSGRYASYWNAFLFCLCFIQPSHKL